MLVCLFDCWLAGCLACMLASAVGCFLVQKQRVALAGILRDASLWVADLHCVGKQFLRGCSRKSNLILNHTRNLARNFHKLRNLAEHGSK